MNYVDNYNEPLKTTCQWCNRYARCDGKGGQLFHITLLHAGIPTLGIYSK